MQQLLDSMVVAALGLVGGRALDVGGTCLRAPPSGTSLLKRRLPPIWEVVQIGMAAALYAEPYLCCVPSLDSPSPDVDLSHRAALPGHWRTGTPMNSTGNS